MESCVLPVKVVPSASRNEIQGWLGDALKIRIQAPPTDGKANAALCQFLAEQLGLSRNAVSLSTGASSRQKRVEIKGMSLAEVKARLCSER